MSLYKVDETLENITRSLESWKSIILDVFNDDDESRINNLNKLKKCIENYSEIEVEYDKTKEAIELLDEKIENEESYEVVDDLFKKCYNSIPENSKESRYQQTNVWKRVLKGEKDVTEIQSSKKKLNDSQYDDLGDSLLCSNIFTPPIDPITKVAVKNVYKNKKCGHVYEYEAIMSYIQQMKHRAKCPYIGCVNVNLKTTDLVPDSELERKIKTFYATQTDDTADDEDDD